MTEHTAGALPPIVDRQAWQTALDDLRKREKAATRELDAIAAQRRRLLCHAPLGGRGDRVAR